jgi:hypothetical protein
MPFIAQISEVSTSEDTGSLQSLQVPEKRNVNERLTVVPVQLENDTECKVIVMSSTTTRDVIAQVLRKNGLSASPQEHYSFFEITDNSSESGTLSTERRLMPDFLLFDMIKDTSVQRKYIVRFDPRTQKSSGKFISDSQATLDTPNYSVSTLHSEARQSNGAISLKLAKMDDFARTLTHIPGPPLPLFSPYLKLSTRSTEMPDGSLNVARLDGFDPLKTISNVARTYHTNSNDEDQSEIPKIAVKEKTLFEDLVSPVLMRGVRHRQ